MTTHNSRPVLVDLEGRQPVVFPVGGDRVVHSMEVTRLLRQFSLSHYQLHQDADGGFRFAYRGVAAEDDLQTALRELLSNPPSLALELLPADTVTRRKLVAYRSDRQPTTS